MDVTYSFREGVAPTVVLRRLEAAMAGSDKGRLSIDLDNTDTGLYVKKLTVIGIDRRTEAKISHELRRFEVEVFPRNLENPLKSSASFIVYLDDKIFALNLNDVQPEEMKALIGILEAIKADLVKGGESMNSHFQPAEHHERTHVPHVFNSFVRAVERFSQGAGDISSRPVTELRQLIAEINSGMSAWQAGENIPPNADFRNFLAAARPLLERYWREEHSARLAEGLAHQAP